MQNTSVVDVGVQRALCAKEAGEVLAALIGLDAPIPAATMWRYGRNGIVKTIRLGRLRRFRTTDLEQFVADGGRGFGSTRGEG